MTVTRRAWAGGLVAALLAAAGLAAQEPGTIAGTVRDATGAPVATATITIPGTPLTVRTGAGGAFRLPGVPAGEVVLRIRAPGFRETTLPTTVPAGDTVTVDVVLAPLISLDTVVVTPGRGRTQLLSQVVASTTVLDDSTIAGRAVRTLDQAVGWVSGVQLLNGQVNIHGSSGYAQGINSRVLLLVDGVPANQGDRGGIHWDLVPVEQVERIEIVKGAGSALYGSAALGGVINIITRELPVGFHGRVRLSGGGYADPPHAVWRFRDRTGLDRGLDVAASYGTQDLRGGFSVGGWRSDGYREQDARDHWQVTGKAEWHPWDSTKVDLSGAWAVDDYEVALLWCRQGECDDRGQSYQPFKIATEDTGSTTVSRKGYLAATISRAPSDRLSWHIRGSWVRTRFNDHRPGTDEFSISNRWGAEARAVLTPAEGRVVTIGTEATVSTASSDIFSGSGTAGEVGRHTQGEYAAYGESEQRLGPARLTAGARIDFLSVDGGALGAIVSPRIGTVLPTRFGIWRATAGRGFRQPSIAERFVRTRAFSFDVVPNPTLVPELAWSFEIGNTLPLRHGLELDAAVFWTEATDLIEPTVVSIDNALKIQFRNLARARLAGLDASLRAAPLRGLQASVGYTYLYARQLATDTTPDRPLGLRPRHLVTVTTDWSGGPFGVGADFRYSSRPEAIELEDLLETIVDDRRVAVAVLDLRASYARGPLGVRVIATNALNYIYNMVPQVLAPVRTVSVVLTLTY
ncbi:MAG: TonB-dependent receptor [Gemmatimonadales bacterium]